MAQEEAFKIEIRAQQEANKGLSQEEKQALRRAKKAAKKAQKTQNEAAPEVAAEPANPVPAASNENPTVAVPIETSAAMPAPAKLTKDGTQCGRGATV